MKTVDMAMEAEDDMIVLVVVDGDDTKAPTSETSDRDPDAPESGTCLEVNDLIETAEKHGEYINVKLEPDDEYQCDYLEENLTSEAEIQVKLEPMDDDNMAYDDEDDTDYTPDYEESEETDKLTSARNRYNRRFGMRKPWQVRSFVAELREQYEELKDDEELLINTLGRIMRTVKAPPPPRDFYIMNGINFECVHCGFIMDTIPAASRHYQEKHGSRYLVCYACGVDFRSTTNLYKHEKRCIAPDAEVVLKARAEFLGRKGRSRPFMKSNKFSSKPAVNKFACQLCSAVFITKNNLESHENLHRGERPFRCHVCPCAYTSYSALSRHTKKHSDVQYICDHCNRSFKIKAALVSHMDTHKPMRKHGCAECSRRFAQKAALLLHVNRVHRNLPPPCACQICPKRYPRMSLLKAHMKRAHGMTIITRKMFFKSLPTMTELEVKQSKVILKYEENKILGFPTAVKSEPYDLGHYPEQNHEDIDNEIETESQQMSVEDFMQYVTYNNPELGSNSNVVYIQNGEEVPMSDKVQDELMLEVEAVMDGQIFCKNVSDEDLRSAGTLVKNNV